MKTTNNLDLFKRLIRLIIINSLLLGLLLILANSLYSFFILPAAVQEKFEILNSGSDFKEGYSTPPETLFGYSPYFSAKIKHTKTSGPMSVFETEYDFDQYGARLNSNPVEIENHIVFLGGSNTFGEGVGNEEVFSTRLQADYQKTKIFNLAYRGWGPDQAWTLIKNHKLIQNKKLKSPSFYYIFYPYHLYRSLNTLQVLANTKGMSPQLEIIDNKIQHIGLMKDSPFFRIKALLGEFTFYKAIENVYYNYNNQNKDFELLLSRFQAIDNEIKKSYPEAKFVIIFPPFSGRIRNNDLLIKKLNDNRIDVIDMPPVAGDSFYFPLDRHLNSLGHLRLSNELVLYLSKFLKN